MSSNSLPADGSLFRVSQIVPLSVVVDGIVNFLNQLLQGLFDFIGGMFATGLKELLFFPSPYDFAGPNQAFLYNLTFALALLPIMVVIGVASMPFANRRKAATWRQMWRVIEVLIFIALARPALHIALVLVNTTGEYVFPESYDLSFAGEGILTSLGAIGVTGLALVIGGYVLSGISFLGILFLFFVLFLREFIFNLIYQGFPILIVAWYLDWGPFKTVNHVSVVVFRLAAYLVLVGPLIALALQVGVVFGGGTWPPDGQPPADPETTVDFWRQFAGWFMGIALACAFGVKAAMMGGVPMSRIGASTTGRKSEATDSGQTRDPSGGSGRGSIGGQLRDTVSAVDRRAPYSGTVGDRISNARDSMSGKWKDVSDRQDIYGATARNLDVAGKTLGPKAKRAGSDVFAGGQYAVSHLHESPADWARASAEHYRDRPIVSNERRAKWMLDNQTSKSMGQADLMEKMGWSDEKTAHVVESMKSAGQIEVFETGRENVIVSRDRVPHRTSDRTSTDEKGGQ